MHGDRETIRVLNGVLKLQLTAINQFFLHARMMGNWGLSRLEKADYQHSIKAMKHADDLVGRVLFLQGLPNLQDLGKLLIGENIPEILGNDLLLQREIRQSLQAAIAYCETAQDYVSRERLDEVLEACEEHIDWLESQQWLIEHSGLENYLQSNL